MGLEAEPNVILLLISMDLSCVPTSRERTESRTVTLGRLYEIAEFETSYY